MAKLNFKCAWCGGSNAVERPEPVRRAVSDGRMLGEISCRSCGNANRVWEVVQWNEMTGDRKVWRLRAEKFRQ